MIYYFVRENVVALRQKQANDEYMSSRKMLLEEYRAEAYSKDQYIRKLKRLEREYKQSKAFLTGPQSPLAKRRLMRRTLIVIIMIPFLHLISKYSCLNLIPP